MSFLGLKVIPPGPGGVDFWSFDHDLHHKNVTTSLNQTVTFTGVTHNNNRLITGLSSVAHLFPGMGISGSGIQAGSTIVGIDPIALNLSISLPATATASVTLSAGFAQIPFYILNPINPDDQRQFLLDHQLSHNFINAALGTLGNDLQDLDFRNQEQVSSWLDLNFIEHQTWEQVAGIT